MQRRQILQLLELPDHIIGDERVIFEAFPSVHHAVSEALDIGQFCYTVRRSVSLFEPIKQ